MLFILLVLAAGLGGVAVTGWLMLQEVLEAEDDGEAATVAEPTVPPNPSHPRGAR